MSEPRDIRVTLTETEWRAVHRTIRGELESLTEADWDSGLFEDLDAALSRFNVAWRRWHRRRVGRKVTT